MTIDESVKYILEYLPDYPATLTPELIVQIRKDQLLLLPEEADRPKVKKIENQLIDGPHGDIPIRIYTPDGQREIFQAVVYFHGGGWTIGSVETHDVVCRKLTNATGCKVISVDYRLAPEHRFPKGLEDCYAATQWVFDNADSLQVSQHHISIGGDSAGGNFAAAITLMAKERKGPKLKSQLLIYPATDALRSITDSPYASIRENAAAPILTSKLTKSFWDYYLSNESDAANKYASPIKAEDLSGLPPALILTAECDPIRDEGEAYGERLRESGVDVKMIRYDGLIHGFVQLPLPINEEVFQKMGMFLKESVLSIPTK
ncbi:alpha/beta hydrolase [Sporosarcina sp. HYO08]|uniref:alpha/beta hydrolase n=1 Tax=Sporosarcina sp. HYO08 TaxID=1759557 RepID=UPI00079A5E98|nr:alpha/beta hydrolase [Sporosarcina sp. HYO08]KXH78565.1 hypothetical protein AU377_12865 [Sporosarcina sp. HYO08]